MHQLSVTRKRIVNLKVSKPKKNIE